MSKNYFEHRDDFFPYPSITRDFPPPKFATQTGIEIVTDRFGRKTSIPVFGARNGGSVAVENPESGPGCHSLDNYRRRLLKAAMDFLGLHPQHQARRKG